MTRAEWAKRKGRSSSFIQRSTRFAIYARDGFDCVYCRGVFPPDYSGQGLTLDHVVPRSLGGHSRPDNLVTACASCNSRRQAGPVSPNWTYFERHDNTAGVQRRFRARIRRALRKPLNRELGRWLALYAGEPIVIEFDASTPACEIQARLDEYVAAFNSRLMDLTITQCRMLDAARRVMFKS